MGRSGTGYRLRSEKAGPSGLRARLERGLAAPPASAGSNRSAHHDHGLAFTNHQHPREEVSNVVSEGVISHAGVPQWVAIPGSRPGSELGGRLRLGGRRLDPASPVPDPRLRGRVVTTRLSGRSRVRTRRRSSVASARTACGRSRRSHRVSEEGRAPKNDPALFALAMAAGLGDEPTRRAALEALPRVARTGTHLFQFATFVEQFRGWGRSLRRAVGGWYAGRPVDALAYQAVKYRQRDGVTHRDLLRLAHPAGNVSAGNPTLEVSAEHAALFEWIVRGTASDGLPRIVEGFVARPSGRDAEAGSGSSCASTGSRARRSSQSTSPLPEVWAALLDDMPMTALVRNLATMTRVGCDRTGFGRHGQGGRAARRRRADPEGSGPPDRRAGGASHLRRRSRCPRPRRLEPGPGGRRRARRGVLHRVRERRADRQAAAARARRVGLDDLAVRSPASRG